MTHTIITNSGQGSSETQLPAKNLIISSDILGIIDSNAAMNQLLLPSDVACFEIERPLISSSQQIIPESLHQASPKRKEEFLSGRYCAFRAMTVLGHPGPFEVDFHPKNRSPIWPIGIVGSITHSKNMAAAIVGSIENFLGLGLDYELIDEGRMKEEFIRYILTSGDSAYYPEIKTKLSKGEYATLVFSAKESFYKCLYPQVQKYFGLQDAQVVEIDFFQGEIVIELLKDLHPNFTKGFSLRGRFVIENKTVKTLFPLKHI